MKIVVVGACVTVQQWEQQKTSTALIKGNWDLLTWFCTSMEYSFAGESDS